jgi:hypothetical protein
MDLPKEAWIILYIWNEPEDWVGGYPSELYQQMLTDQYGKAPLHFDTYEDAVKCAKQKALYSYIIIPIAGAQAIKLERDNRQLTIPDVVGQSEQFICPCCGSDKTYKTEAYHCNRCAVTTEV